MRLILALMFAAFVAAPALGVADSAFRCVSPSIWWNYGDTVKVVFTPLARSNLSVDLYVDGVATPFDAGGPAAPTTPLITEIALAVPNIPAQQSGRCLGRRHWFYDGTAEFESRSRPLGREKGTVRRSEKCHTLEV